MHVRAQSRGPELPAHQKAADYTLAKGRFGLLSMAFGSAVLIGWTLLGGLESLNVALRESVLTSFGPKGPALFERLTRDGVMLRDRAKDIGLGVARISIGTQPEMERLMKKIKRYWKK